MPNGHLVEFVKKLRKSGIKISISAPRSKTMIRLREEEYCLGEMDGLPIQKVNFLQPKTVGDFIIPH